MELSIGTYKQAKEYDNNSNNNKKSYVDWVIGNFASENANGNAKKLQINNWQLRQHIFSIYAWQRQSEAKALFEGQQKKLETKRRK